MMEQKSGNIELLTRVQQDYETALPPTSLDGCRHMVRRFKELRPVLYDVASCGDIDGELPVYEVHRDSCDEVEQGILLKHGLRHDVTIMPALTLGKEYVKTLGHTHFPRKDGWSHPEIFEVLEGEVHFLLQRYRGEELADVSLVVAQQGDVVLVPPNCGHVMINASSKQLIVGNLVSRDCSQSCKPFIERKGAACFVLRGRRLVKNPNYPSLPEVRTLKPSSFGLTEYSGLLESFVKRPDLFEFLSAPNKLQKHSSLQRWDNLDMSPLVSIVVPTLNEVKSIGEIVSNIPLGWEVILVDLSTDGTAEKAKSLRPDVRIISRGPREVGKGAAIRLGFREARGPIVVMMDGDGSHQTSELVKLVSALETQNADLVQASRMVQAGASEEMGPYEHTVRYFGNRVLTLLINMLFHSWVTDSQYGFRAFRKEFISELSLRSNGWDIETEIVARAAKSGGKIVEIPSVELGRKHGESHLGLLRFAIVVGRRLLIEIFRR
jgi:oxalate decarboxylase/phosphoglucose isomerase-like protein (cupin superfamily)